MRFSLLALISLAAPAAAGEFLLSSPIDCDLEGPCFIQQYVDHDTSENATDFSCSSLSYDGHKGTDFALPTHDMIAKGVDVFAAAAGTVSGVRDGMADRQFGPENAAEVENRECGNGVVLRHPAGWETQYCHLRQGSVSVESGQQVQAGDVLGEVGMSGRAEFPHLHLSVRHNGAVIDPFDPDGTITCGETDPDTLWSVLPPYRPGGIISIGTSATVPEFSAIRENTVPPAAPDSDALVIYAFVFGTQKGDTLRLSLTGPEGRVVDQDVTLERTQAQSFRAVGKKRRSARWPAGTYDGTVILLRAGEMIEEQTLVLTLP